MFEDFHTFIFKHSVTSGRHRRHGEDSSCFPYSSHTYRLCKLSYPRFHQHQKNYNVCKRQLQPLNIRLHPEPEYLSRRRLSRISGANFLTVFHSNYGSILLSFRDLITGRMTDGRRTDVGNHRIIWSLTLYSAKLIIMSHEIM